MNEAFVCVSQPLLLLLLILFYLLLALAARGVLYGLVGSCDPDRCLLTYQWHLLSAMVRGVAIPEMHTFPTPGTLVAQTAHLSRRCARVLRYLHLCKKKKGGIFFCPFYFKRRRRGGRRGVRLVLEVSKQERLRFISKSFFFFFFYPLFFKEKNNLTGGSGRWYAISS